MSQKQIVKRHLERYGSITSWTAYSRYHITRLAGRIYELVKDGMKIERESMHKGRIVWTRYTIEA